MKKLLDETTDDLARALLEAGRSHRPPTANQAKLLVTLGVGAGLGLFSSKAFAWLGTSGGKLTLLSVSLGIAGVVYTALPAADEAARVEARSSLAPAVSSPEVAPPGVPTAPPSFPRVSSASPAPGALGGPALSVPALVAEAPSNPRPDSVSSSRVSNSRVASGVRVHREHAPAVSEAPRRTSRDQKSTAARRDDVLTPLETQPEGPLPAALEPPAVGAPEPREARASGLESEIHLVDAMRGAAQRNDTSALRRLVESYRGAFPAGQLRQEVSELALHALPTPSR